jgi:hypothetical protein
MLRNKSQYSTTRKQRGLAKRTLKLLEHEHEDAVLNTESAPQCTCLSKWRVRGSHGCANSLESV